MGVARVTHEAQALFYFKFTLNYFKKIVRPVI